MTYEELSIGNNLRDKINKYGRYLELLESIAKQPDHIAPFIAIPYHDPSMCMYRDITDLPPHLFEEISNFFEVYKLLENKKTAIKEIVSRDEAITCIQNCIESYQSKFQR